MRNIRILLLAFAALFCVTLYAQSPQAIIEQADVAHQNGEYKVALNSYNAAVDLAMELCDTTTAVEALGKIVSVGMSLKKPELTLSAQQRIIELNECRSGYDDFQRLFDYGDLLVYLAKGGKEPEATKTMTKLRKYTSAFNGDDFGRGY